MREDDEPRVDPKHPVYYMLLWIVYIDNYYNIHEAPKFFFYKYLVRIYWMPSELKYRNIKFIYRWHLTKEQ